MSEYKVQSRTEQIRKLVVEYMRGMRMFSGENSDIPETKANFSLDIAISELCLPDDPNAQGTRGLLKQIDELLARPSVPQQGQTIAKYLQEAVDLAGGSLWGNKLPEVRAALAASRSEEATAQPKWLGAPAAGSTEREKFVQEAVDYLKGMAKLYTRDGELTAGNTLSKVAIGIRSALLNEPHALAGTDTDVAKEKK